MTSCHRTSQIRSSNLEHNIKTSPVWRGFYIKDKGVIVLCRTSSPGAGEFQDLQFMVTQTHTKPLYQIVAEIIRDKWNYNGNCFLVVGATYPNELKIIRSIVGDMGLLNPGVGKQGATVGDVLSNGLNSINTGVVINASRDIIFASSEEDFAEKAREKAIDTNKDIEICLIY